MMSEIYNCQFLKEKLSEGGQLIDVRSPIEFNNGALNGAVNMPISNFQNLKDDLNQDRPILLYCRTGARSGMVKRYLEQLGFEQVHNIGGVQQYLPC